MCRLPQAPYSNIDGLEVLLTSIPGITEWYTLDHAVVWGFQGALLFEAVDDEDRELYIDRKGSRSYHFNCPPFQDNS